MYLDAQHGQLHGGKWAERRFLLKEVSRNGLVRSRLWLTAADADIAYRCPVSIFRVAAIPIH